jgi:hypothetical protein
MSLVEQNSSYEAFYAPTLSITLVSLQSRRRLDMPVCIVRKSKRNFRHDKGSWVSAAVVLPIGSDCHS